MVCVMKVFFSLKGEWHCLHLHLLVCLYEDEIHTIYPFLFTTNVSSVRFFTFGTYIDIYLVDCHCIFPTITSIEAIIRSSQLDPRPFCLDAEFARKSISLRKLICMSESILYCLLKINCFGGQLKKI